MEKMNGRWVSSNEAFCKRGLRSFNFFKEQSRGKLRDEKGEKWRI